MTTLSALDVLRLKYLSQHGGLPSDPPMSLRRDKTDDTPTAPPSEQRSAELGHRQSCGKERSGDAPD